MIPLVEARIVALSPRPKWWRPFARRYWQRCCDVVATETFRDFYGVDRLEDRVRQERSVARFRRKGRR